MRPYSLLSTMLGPGDKTQNKTDTDPDVLKLAFHLGEVNIEEIITEIIINSSLYSWTFFLLLLLKT